MRIETSRLTIRSFRETDIAGYAAIVADPEVTRFLAGGSPHSYDQAAAYVRECIESEAREGFARYAVLLGETGELIGFCGFKRRGEDIDFGWRYAREAWGQGYATEAAAAVLDHGANTLGLSRIVAQSATENVGSVRVMEKIGLRFEGFAEVRGRRMVRYRQLGGTQDIDGAGAEMNLKGQSCPGKRSQ
jgi:RimJ/RimL family protein N-acetyltransferase